MRQARPIGHFFFLKRGGRARLPLIIVIFLSLPFAAVCRGQLWENVGIGGQQRTGSIEWGPSGREVSAGVSTSGLPLHLLQQIGDGLPGRINLIWAAAAAGKGQNYGRKPIDMSRAVSV